MALVNAMQNRFEGLCDSSWTNTPPRRLLLTESETVPETIAAPLVRYRLLVAVAPGASVTSGDKDWSVKYPGSVGISE